MDEQREQNDVAVEALGLVTEGALYWQQIAGKLMREKDQVHRDLTARLAAITAELQAAREQSERYREASPLIREHLARIVGAFTSGVYCSNCGDPVDDCDCMIGEARAVLSPSEAPAECHGFCLPSESVFDAACPAHGARALKDALGGEATGDAT